MSAQQLKATPHKARLTALHEINECDAQIPYIIKNLRSPNKVRGNNRLTAVIEYTLITFHN